VLKFVIYETVVFTRAPETREIPGLGESGLVEYDAVDD
jgi:hypothetical protein